MKTFLYAWLLAFLLSVNGCALYTITHPDKYTPEQLEALSKMGLDVYQCLWIAGPAPAGAVTIIMAPKGKHIDIAFGGNCQLMKAATADEILMKLDKPLK